VNEENDLEALGDVLQKYCDAVRQCAENLRRFETVELARLIDEPVIGPIVAVELERRRVTRIK